MSASLHLLLSQPLNVDKCEDDVIQHRNHIRRDIEVRRMRLFQNTKILPMEPDELDVRLGGLHLTPTMSVVIIHTQVTYPTMR